MRRGAAQKSAGAVSQKSEKKSDKTLKNDLAVWKEPTKGLKNTVAPLAGAWIEIVLAFLTVILAKSRTPRGCVD